MAKKLLGLFLLSLLLAPFMARAVSLRPAKFFLTIDPGAEQVVTLTVVNNRPERKSYAVAIISAGQNEAGATIFLPGAGDAEAWVTAEPERFVLSPEQSAEIKFTIRVPGLTSPGARHLGLVVEEDSADGGNVGVRGGAAAVVTLQVAGAAEEKLDFAMNIDSSIWRKNFTANFDYDNAGNIDLKFKTNLTVTDWRERGVLSGETDYPFLLVQSKYRDSVAVDPPGRWILFNVYTVRADVSYGRLAQTARLSETVVFVSPWLAAAVGLGVILMLIWRLGRSKKYAA